MIAFKVFKPFEVRMKNIDVRIVAVGQRIVRIQIGERPPGHCTSYLTDVLRAPDELDYSNRIMQSVGDNHTISVDESNNIILHNAEGRMLLRIASSSVVTSPEARLRLEMMGQQHLYGLGEGGQQFDRLGTSRRFWNFQANRAQGADIAVPFMISQAGYGVFFDNSAFSRIEHGDANEGGTILNYSSASGPFDIYVFVGDMRTILGDLAGILGPATMPPLWSLGYLQSTRFFTSPEEIIQLGKDFREKNILCDAIIFLSTYGTGLGWNAAVGSLEFEPKLFADPGHVIGSLRELGFRVFSHEYPVVHPNTQLYQEARQRGFLLEHRYPDTREPDRDGVSFKEGQSFIDFSQPEAREWWWNAHRHLLDQGIDGWWLDGGEGPPEHVALAAGSSKLVHNRFDLWRQLAFAEGEARDRPNRRPFLLCRSGGPGMSKLGAIPWSGDINTTFETMETQIRTGLNLGLSGIPHWGTDAGGFFCVGPDQGELFVRWLQFSAFCTLFRAHGHVWRRHLPWAYGQEITDICRDIIELRYSLMPLTYSLVWQARETGLPTMRALVLNYPDDPHVWDLGTEYLWGDDILVAPVTRRGATHWPVYLPADTWYDYWTGERYSGPRGITVESPLDRIPLFIRAGAIIPRIDPATYSAEIRAEALELLMYPRDETSFTIYEDDGLTNAYAAGEHVTTTFSCVNAHDEVVIGIQAPVGTTSLLPEVRTYGLRVRLDSKPAAVFVNGSAIAEGASDGPGWSYTSDLFAHVQGVRGPAEVKIKIQQ